MELILQIKEHVLFKTTDFDEFDRIYAMDSQNVADILDKARSEEDEQKSTTHFKK